MNKKPDIKISIIIINYMTYDFTVNAIESIHKFTNDISYEIILVDNASLNNDSEKLSEYVQGKEYISKYIKNIENVGFGKSNNIALKHASGKYVLFFNSDCELTENTLLKCFEFMENADNAGAVGARVVLEDGTLDAACKRGFPTPSASLFYFLKLHKISKNPVFDQYKLYHLDEFKMAEIDAVSGAFLFSERALINKVNAFDEKYFMYGEDLDLCFKIKKLGHKIYYNPDLGKVIHYRGRSSKKRKFKTLFNFYEAMFIFYNNNYKKDKNIFVTILVYISISFAYLVSLIKNVFYGVIKNEK